MRAFDVHYEVPASPGGDASEVNSCRVIAPSADWAAEKVAKDHNARVNGRDFWVHAVIELPGGG